MRGPGWGGAGPPGGLSLPSLTPAPRDLVILVAVVFVTYSLQFFGVAAAIPALLRLSPAVWGLGFVWQLVTYPFAGYGGPSLWIILELLILYWFGRDVYYSLGRRRFWRTLLTVAVTAALAAVVVELLVGVVSSSGMASIPFTLMQGQRFLLTFMIAAFATLNSNATILLFFVLPIQARWFLWLEILVAFIAFLGNHDLAGLVGIVVTVALTFGLLSAGGLGRTLREWRLRAERRRLEAELRRGRKKRKLELIDGGAGPEPPHDPDVRRGPWVH